MAKKREPTASEIAQQREAEFIAANPGKWVNCANIRDRDRNFVLCTFCIGGSPVFHRPGRRERIELVTLRIPHADYLAAFHPYEDGAMATAWALFALEEPFPYPESPGYYGEPARKMSGPD